MLRTRVIPCLLLRKLGLVKGQQFANHKYVGDPMNAIKLFNEMQADELVLLDIDATREGRKMSPSQVELFASEARMPISVGGGIRNVEDARDLLKAGVEKVVLNSALFENPVLISQIAEVFGSQAVMVAIDVKKNWLGRYEIYSHSGTKKQKRTPNEWAAECTRLGAGEILVNSIDRDGMMKGYDLELLKSISSSVSVPVIAGCGSNSVADFADAIHKGGADAVSAGSQFVFHGPRRAVLISFPQRSQIDTLLRKS